jgi:hypothetical protein
LSRQADSSQHLNLTTGGITLLGVLLSVGATVGFGLSGPWWLRLLSGAGTTMGLLLVVKVGSRSGAGPLARLAGWVISADEEQVERGRSGRPNSD